MKSKPNRQSKTFFALALMLTISLMAYIQFTAVNAQTTGTVTINNGAAYTNSTAVTLTLSATNATDMCFSNDSSTWSSWEPYATTKNVTILSAEGAQAVYVQYRDSGNITSTASASITLDITPPVPELEWQPYSADYKTVSFSAYYSTDLNGIKNATVNFGDGNYTVLTNSQFTHTYSAVGNYTVTLTMTDVAGNTASINRTVTVPDASTIPTSTPAPTVTTQPTYNPTNQPTATAPPSSTTTPSTLDPLTMIVLVGAIGIIVIVIFAIVLILRRKPKNAKPQQQESAPAQSPPPQQKPQPPAPSGPSESNFTI